MASLVDKEGPVDAATLTPQQRYTLEEFMPRMGFQGGVKDLPAWLEMMRRMSLWGLEDRITCPLMNVSSTGEGRLMYENAMSFFAKLPNPRNRFVLTDEDDGAEVHCQIGNPSLAHQIMFDWLDGVLVGSSNG